MSHIDSGALHAYLDGALDEFPVAEAEEIRDHLEACAECAERLESERRVRADAQSMLGMANPQVELPSLEELRAYVKRTRPEPVSARRRMARLGWAASVVLAVGAGWMLRGGQLQEATINQRDGFAGARGASSAAPATAAEETLDRTAGFADRTGNAGSSEGLVAEEREAIAVPQVRGDRVASEATPARQAATQAKAGSASLDEVLEDRDLPASIGAAAEVRAPAPAAGPDRRSEQSARALPSPSGVLRPEEVGLRDASDLVRSAAGTSAELVATAAPAPAPAPGTDAPSAATATANAVGGGAGSPDAEPVVEDERRAERRLSESPVPITSALSQTGRGSVREVAQDDDRFSDEPSLGVPGFEVVSVTSLGEGTKPLGVRVVQRLEAGAMLEVYHLEPGIDVATVPPLPRDLNEVRVETDMGWVVVRGPRSEDELEVLLGRLFPK